MVEIASYYMYALNDGKVMNADFKKGWNILYIVYDEYEEVEDFTTTKPAGKYNWYFFIPEDKSEKNFF